MINNHVGLSVIDESAPPCFNEIVFAALCISLKIRDHFSALTYFSTKSKFLGSCKPLVKVRCLYIFV